MISQCVDALLLLVFWLHVEILLNLKLVISGCVHPWMQRPGELLFHYLKELICVYDSKLFTRSGSM
jgi:hypothetical protein